MAADFFCADFIWIQKDNPDEDFMGYYKSFWHKVPPPPLSVL